MRCRRKYKTIVATATPPVPGLFKEFSKFPVIVRLVKQFKFLQRKIYSRYVNARRKPEKCHFDGRVMDTIAFYIEGVWNQDCCHGKKAFHISKSV